jgi:hydrogenase nickel incorporation protein HypA/HybF
MHELAVCQGLIAAVERVAREHRASVVTDVTVRVGVLSGVEPELLQRAFEIARAGTIARDAHMRIEAMPARVVCASCGTENEVALPQLTCAACGDWRVRVMAGDELLLTEVGLDRDDPDVDTEQPAAEPEPARAAA